MPLNGDVAQLKRLFQYQAQNKLLPALQASGQGLVQQGFALQ